MWGRVLHVRQPFPGVQCCMSAIGGQAFYQQQIPISANLNAAYGIPKQLG